MQSNQPLPHTNAISLGYFSLIGSILCAALSIAIFIGAREGAATKTAGLVSVGFFAVPVLSLILSLND